jgi:hypothetical protein
LRGASAIQSALDEVRSRQIRAFVVWEPMLPTDWGLPRSFALSRVHDPRASQFWDKKHLLSKALGGPERLTRSDGVNKIGFEMGAVIWDFVAVYPPGSDHPSFTGAPVVQVIDDVRAELARVAKN